MLVPTDSLLSHPLVDGVSPEDWDEPRLRRIANSFGVSQEVILRRLLTEEMTTIGFYRHMRREWARRPVPPKRAGGGADPVGDCIYEHSRSFTQLVAEATRLDVMSFGEAADALDMKSKYLNDVFEQVT